MHAIRKCCGRRLLMERIPRALCVSYDLSANTAPQLVLTIGDHKPIACRTRIVGRPKPIFCHDVIALDSCSSPSRLGTL